MPTAPKRVLCLMDIAGVGRSSLGVVLPVLSACGVQACPLPPLFLSSHTGGFGDVPRMDTTSLCQQALAHYHQQNVEFDAIYTGYLLGAQQFQLAEAAFAQYPAAYKIVDPVLGDHEKLYSGIQQDSVARMKSLCEKADLITPNLTECAVLSGLDASETLAASAPKNLHALCGEKGALVVTSAPCEDENKMNLLVCRKNQPEVYITVEKVPQNYPGTGDLFTAALTGLYLQGLGLEQAARKAAAFVGKAVQATYAGGGQPRMGVWFEPFLPLLSSENPPALN